MADLIREAPLTYSLEERVEYAVETITNMARLPWRQQGTVTMPLDLSPSTALVGWYERDVIAMGDTWTVDFELPYSAEDDDHLRDHARLALRQAYERELLDLRSMVAHCGDKDGRYGGWIAAAEQVLAHLSAPRLEAVSD